MSIERKALHCAQLAKSSALSRTTRKMALLFLLSALPAAAPEPLAPAQCRCTDVTAACFKSIPFAALNASVGGRLVAVEDEFGACLKHGE